MSRPFALGGVIASVNLRPRPSRSGAKAPVVPAAA